MVKSKKQDDGSSEYYGKSELLVTEKSLAFYNKFIVKQFIKFSKIGKSKTKAGRNDVPFRTLDFGAGYGTLALIWKELSGQSVECLEIDAEQLNEIRKRGFIGWNSVSEVKEKYDFIYSSNVLEHIEADQACLIELAKLLEQNGRIGIYVPAFMLLFSDMDRSVGHYRRYSRKELIEKIEAAGLAVVCCKYVDIIGFFASFVIKLLGWKSIGNLGSPTSLKIYDRLIFPLSRFIDRLTYGRMLGKNLFLIAEK